MNEVKADLAILKSQSGTRVRDFLLEKLHKITPEANLAVTFPPFSHPQEIQQSELLPQAPMMLFLKKHIPKTFEEVSTHRTHKSQLKKQYVNSVKELLFNRVKTYREQ